MTKADIVNEITKKTGIDKTTVLTTVEAFMDAVKDSLSNDENVYLRGFGSFVVKKRAQKTARNISKNTTIIILADIGRQHLVSHSIVCLCREGEPAVCIAVVDHNICYCAYAVGFEFGNQTSEFSLSSE